MVLRQAKNKLKRKLLLIESDLAHPVLPVFLGHGRCAQFSDLLQVKPGDAIAGTFLRSTTGAKLDGALKQAFSIIEFLQAEVPQGFVKSLKPSLLHVGQVGRKNQLVDLLGFLKAFEDEVTDLA